MRARDAAFCLGCDDDDDDDAADVDERWRHQRPAHSQACLPDN